jgi:hypothetical protein
VIKPDDLNPKQRKAYGTWVSLGLTHNAAVAALHEDGLLATTEHDQLTRTFREVFGMSEGAARVAADGRGGPPVRPVSEVTVRSVARPEPGDAWKLVAKIEEFASDLCHRGVSEEKALRDAAFAVFEAAPDSLQDWVAAVADRRWPGLWGPPRSSRSGQNDSPSGRTSGTVRG